MPERPIVSCVRNVLISCGVFWVVQWIALLLGLWLDPFIHISAHSENLFTAIYMGAALSWERTVSAAVAGIAITLVIAGCKSYLWALLAAALYAIDFRTHVSWAVVPTAWDLLENRAERLLGRFLPAIVCIIAAFVTAYLRRQRQARRSSATQGPVTMSN